MIRCTMMMMMILCQCQISLEEVVPVALGWNVQGFCFKSKLKIQAAQNQISLQNCKIHPKLFLLRVRAEIRVDVKITVTVPHDRSTTNGAGRSCIFSDISDANEDCHNGARPLMPSLANALKSFVLQRLLQDLYHPDKCKCSPTSKAQLRSLHKNSGTDASIYQNIRRNVWVDGG